MNREGPSDSHAILSALLLSLEPSQDVETQVLLELQQLLKRHVVLRDGSHHQGSVHARPRSHMCRWRHDGRFMSSNKCHWRLDRKPISSNLCTWRLDIPRCNRPLHNNPHCINIVHCRYSTLDLSRLRLRSQQHFNQNGYMYVHTHTHTHTCIHVTSGPLGSGKLDLSCQQSNHNTNKQKNK